MEHATTDQLMETQTKDTRQQSIQLYRVAKAVQLLHQGKWLTRDQVQRKFPHLMDELNALGTTASWGGGIDPDGYCWPPAYP